jgi:hypothetical protein
VERARARLNWAELLAGRLTLHQLQVLHPLAHVDVYQDGSTNFPGVKARLAAAPGGKTEELLRLAVDEAELVDGRLDWNQEKIRLDGVASGVYVELGYHAADDHYEGKARVGQVRMQLPQWKSLTLGEPLTLGAEGEFRLYHDRVEMSRLRVNEAHGWVVEANGAVSGLASPVAQFAYRAAGDAAQLARLVHYRELESGAVQLSGQGTYRWDRGEYAVVGKAQAAGVSWADEIVRLEKISGVFAERVFAKPRALQRLRDLCHGAGRNGAWQVGRQSSARQGSGGPNRSAGDRGGAGAGAARIFHTRAAACEVAAGGLDGRHAAGEVAGQSAERADGREPAGAAAGARGAVAGDGRGAGYGGLQGPVGAGAQRGCEYAWDASFRARAAVGKLGFEAGCGDGGVRRAGADGDLLARQPGAGPSD